MPTSPPTHLATLALVALGGALGALLRVCVGLALPTLGAMPTGTLAANLIGCLLLGIVAAKVASISRPPAWLQQGVGVGLLGSFTSTSTFASEAFFLGTQASPLLNAGYVAASLFGGLALAGLGARLASASPARPSGGEP
ncbi:fluoride efflux transporter FluC [Lujinxingia litoralis]|nr:CrcB family protein [Lujinxingia litoralis]